MRNLLVYRFVIANTLAFALVVALGMTGHLLPLFEGDYSRLTIAIVMLFATGWWACFVSVCHVSADLNRAKSFGHIPATELEADKARLKSEWLDGIAEWLVALGLLGTVVGFSMSLAGIDQGSVGDASGAQSAVGNLMVGMRVALNTTLIGAALGIWHEVNMRMLKTAMGCYWIDRVRANSGEIAARGQD